MRVPDDKTGPRFDPWLAQCAEAERGCISAVFTLAARAFASRSELVRTLEECAYVCDVTTRIIMRTGTVCFRVAEICAAACAHCADVCLASRDPALRDCALACQRCARGLRRDLFHVFSLPTTVQLE